MKDKIKFLDCIQWRTTRAGFKCYKCEKYYPGKQRGLQWNGKMACIPCAEKQGLYVAPKV